MNAGHTALAVRRLQAAIDEFEQHAGRDPSARKTLEQIAGLKDGLGELTGGKGGLSPGRKAALEASQGGPTDFATAGQQAAGESSEN